MAEHQVMSWWPMHHSYKRDLVSQSGKEALLPAPPPLRTVRAPFKAHGSSLSERPFSDDAV